eukprot:5518806-Pyramimonas_sp.AAC.3
MEGGHLERGPAAVCRFRRGLVRDLVTKCDPLVSPLSPARKVCACGHPPPGQGARGPGLKTASVPPLFDPDRTLHVIPIDSPCDPPCDPPVSPSLSPFRRLQPLTPL